MGVYITTAFDSKIVSRDGRQPSDREVPLILSSHHPHFHVHVHYHHSHECCPLAVQHRRSSQAETAEFPYNISIHASHRYTPFYLNYAVGRGNVMVAVHRAASYALHSAQ